MASKTLLLLGVLLAAAVLVSSEMVNRKLGETHEKNGAGVVDEKYGGYPGGGYPGGGYPGGHGGRYPGGGYPGGGHGPGGGYPGGGHGPGGGYPGGGYPGGGHRCRYGCCGHGYNGCRCCVSPNDIPEPEFLPEINT